MKPHSKATKKWDQKTERIPKTYKLKKSVVDGFAEACGENEASQAEILTLLMTAYADGYVYSDAKRKKAAVFLPERG
jgi:hypothetical protein